MSAAPLVLGTAGHVDHGKTTLVGALTGKDTDRLAEEKARGLSIELGYAPLELPSGRRLSVVDVPGHERFVRTMVAGATGIDLFLLCVAADDGVMPQTREHMTVLRALGVERGVIAVTKADLADPARAAAEAAELVSGAETVATAAGDSAVRARLLEALDRATAGFAGRGARGGPAVLHVDRAFTLHGIGTVVTGTLWSGEVGVGDRVTLMPGGRSARVRSVQVHDAPRERAGAGQRVALNLAGVSLAEVSRGDVVCGDGAAPAPAYRVHARVELRHGVEPLRRGERLHVHHGTREAPARVTPLGEDSIEAGAPAPCRLRCEAPLVVAPGDRLVLRRLAPPDTIGGGVVVEPPRRPAAPKPETAPDRHEPRAEPGPGAVRMAQLLRDDGERPRSDAQLAVAAGLDEGAAARELRLLERSGRAVRVGRDLHFDPDALSRLVARVVAVCEREGSVTIARVRDELGSGRRRAQALLEHLDAAKITVRRGDAHVLKRRR
jgi:selenocysteine-specific elongation factor